VRGTTIINGRQDRPLVVGKGTLVGAGSVVTKLVPPGAKVAGNPARSLRELAQRGLAAQDLSLLESSYTGWRRNV
jgi:acetyltransferase-like isoleucine patch superfamily enzyme